MITDYNISEVSPIVKPETAYVLGFIWADGCVYKWPNRNSQMVKISIVTEDMNNIKNILNKVFKWKYEIGRLKKGNWKELTNAIIYKRGICNFLIENGYKSKIDSACKILSHIPENLHVYWFRGLIDGDGCFYFNKNKKSAHLGIYSEYDQNWKFVESLYNRLGIRYSIYRRKRKKGAQSEIRITRVEDVVKFGDWLYADSNFMGLERKYRKCLQIKNEVLPNIRKRWTKFKGVYFFPKRKHWYISPIIKGKIKRIGGFKSDIEANECLKQFSIFSGKNANW